MDDNCTYYSESSKNRHRNQTWLREGPDWQLAHELHEMGVFPLLTRLGLEGLQIFPQCTGNESLSFTG